MELLVREPDHTTLISVGHRPELELFHTRKIDVGAVGRASSAISIWKTITHGD
jgi:ABC-type uncharacterized transport system fused permease/ATPase subunit